MALDKQQLKEQYLQLMKDMSTKTSDPEQAREEFAERFSTMIDDYIKQADVIVQPGQLVTTAGTAVAQVGQTTTLGQGGVI